MMAGTGFKEIGRHTVEILLSTYNGGRFLEDQLDSILAQTYGDWRLTLRDDGSTDDTLDIIKGYVERHPGKIRRVEDSRGRLGPCGSFAALLEGSVAPYIMFADQDDRWLPDKIEDTLKAFATIERKHGDSPILVHTDMIVADGSLREVAKSFWKFQHINPDFKTLNSLLIMNNVTGCTIMMNEALKKMVLPVPPEAILHDWWIALVASAFGHTGYVSTPTMLYRQHGGNEAGAVGYTFGYFASRLSNLGKTSDVLKRAVAQGRAFFDRYGSSLSKEDYEVVRDFSGLFERGRAARLLRLLRHRIRGYGFLRNLGVLVLWVSIGRLDARAGRAVKGNA